MNSAPSPQMGERGYGRVPRTGVQFSDVQKQKGPINVPSLNAPIRQQPNSPHTQLHQQQQQALDRSLSDSPAQHAALHRSMSVSPVPHPGQFEGPQQPARRMSSPQQMYISPISQDGGLPSPPPRMPMPTLQDGRYPSPTKRASFDPHLEHVAPPVLQEQQRYASPTKRKTVVANPTSFNITSRPQMAPAQQEVASPRKSMIQQGQLLSPRKSMIQQAQFLSPRKSTMMMPQSQLVSPRNSMMEQQDQGFSPRKSMLLQQGNARTSLSIYPENSVQSLEQENIPAAASYNRMSMSTSPAVHVPRFDEEEEDAYDDDDDSHTRHINRATSMSPVAPSVRFQENDGVLLPSTSIKRSTSFSPAAQSTIKQQQASLPAKMQPNLNARLSISPRQIQTQQQSQQPSSPARLQSSINRSKSMSPTQMIVEQQPQPQPRLSSGHLAAVQGVRPGSPPQFNRYLSTVAPRVSMITPNRTSNTFQPQQLLLIPSSKQMQVGRRSVNLESASSSSRGPMTHERHLSVTDVALRSMAAIASAVAFCVMITNTLWINGQIVSYSNIAGFRYVAGISASAFTISILQLGFIVSQKLRSHTLGVEVKPSMRCLFSSMIVDQLFAYLLLSAGSVGVGALVYIPSICKSGAEISAEFCSRSTLSVVLTLIVGTIFVMSASLSTFKFYQKVIRPL